MARLDGRGPLGAGSMTGRGMGYCAGEVAERQFYGRGMGRANRRRPDMTRGFGRCMAAGFDGRGFGRYYVDEAEYLLDSRESLEKENRELRQRLDSLEEKLNNLNDK